MDLFSPDIYDNIFILSALVLFFPLLFLNRWIRRVDRHIAWLTMSFVFLIIGFSYAISYVPASKTDPFDYYFAISLVFFAASIINIVQMIFILIFVRVYPPISLFFRIFLGLFPENLTIGFDLRRRTDD